METGADLGATPRAGSPPIIESPPRGVANAIDSESNSKNVVNRHMQAGNVTPSSTRESYLRLEVNFPTKLRSPIVTRARSKQRLVFLPSHLYGIQPLVPSPESLAEVVELPEWNGESAEMDDRYLGRTVLSPKPNYTALTKLVYRCNGHDTRSPKCFNIHLSYSRKKLRAELGDRTFKELGLPLMGREQFGQWTLLEKEQFDLLVFDESLGLGYQYGATRSIFRSFFSSREHPLSRRSIPELVRYYYNVFVPDLLRAKYCITGDDEAFWKLPEAKEKEKTEDQP